MGAADPQGNCHGEALGVASMEGCEGHFCEAQDIQSKYLRVVESGLRGEITPSVVSSMATRLESLRRFYRVDSICSKDENGVVDVTFRVFPRTMIRSLKISGNVQVYTEEIR